MPAHPSGGRPVLIPTRGRVWHVLDDAGDPLCGRRGPDFSSVERGEDLDPEEYMGMVCCACAKRNRVEFGAPSFTDVREES